MISVSENFFGRNRINYFLCILNLNTNVQYVCYMYNHTSISGHIFVVLHFHTAVVERGPGLLVSNNTLLSDDIYVEILVKL